MSEVVVIARIACDPGFQAEIYAATLELAQASQVKDGCLAYEVFAKAEQPEGDLLIHEIWRDSDALRLHGQCHHVQAFKDAIRGRATVKVRKLTDF